MSTIIATDVQEASVEETNLTIDNNSIYAANTLKWLQGKFGSYVDNDNYGGATVVDISYPTIKKYVLKTLSENESPLKEKISEFIRLIDNLEGQIKRGVMNDADLQRFSDICFMEHFLGSEKSAFFKISPNSNASQTMEIFKKLISNYTGFQRVVSILLMKMIDEITPIINSAFKSSIILALDEIIDGEKTAVFNEERNTACLFSNTNFDVASMMCHEITHAWQYMLGIAEALFDLNNFVIKSLIADSKKSYVSVYFPMLQKDIMERNTKLIADQLPTNEDLEKNCSGIFSSLKWYIQETGFDSLITNALTKENVAKAIYLMATNYYYNDQYGKGQHSGGDPLEMLTMFGIIPFRFGTKTMLLVDRQNQNAFIHRNNGKMLNTYYSSSYFNPANVITRYILDFKNAKEKTNLEMLFKENIPQDNLYSSKQEFFTEQSEENEKIILGAPEPVVDKDFLSDIPADYY